MSMDLEGLLEKSKAGEWEFDKAELLQVLKEEEVVPFEHRFQIYQWLLVGNSIPSGIPESFEEFTKEAGEDENVAAKQLVAAVADMIENTPMLKQDPSLPCELSGMIYYLCKKTGRQFQKSFLSVIGPVITLAYSEDGEEKLMHIAKLFPILYSILGEYLPEVAESPYSKAVEEIVRLGLQYHDPEISFHLDRSHVTIGPFVVNWWSTMFSTMFSSAGGNEEDGVVCPDVLNLWDWILIEGEAMLTTYIPLVFVMENRRGLLGQMGKEEVTQFLQTFTAENIFASCKEVVQKSRLLMKNTPFSSRRILKRILFPASSSLQLNDAKSLQEYFLSFVALPIDAAELVDTFACPEDGARKAHLNFVILDCRSEKSFNYARLPTALHVGNEIGFEPALLDDMVKRFDNARGSHLCILGTGRELEQELNLLKIIVLHFVQAGFKHVGFADGGFKACIPHIKAGKIEVVRTPGAEAPGAPKASPSTTTTSGGGAKDASSAQAAETAKILAANAKAGAAKAASSVSGWVKSWGFGSKKGYEKVAENQQQDLTAGREELSTTGGSEKKDGSQSAAGGVISTPEEGGTSSSVGRKDTSSPPQSAGSSKMFTLGEGGEDDDEDFDLITSVASPAPAAGPSCRKEEKELETEKGENAPPAPSPKQQPEEEEPSVSAVNSTPSPTVTPAKKASDPLDFLDEDPTAESPAPKPTKTVTSSGATAPSTSQAKSTTSAESHPFDDIFV